MAAHDDKVSVNRRRLFKALSAAPVVITLSPGSALAQSSAFQCLTNDAPPITPFIGEDPLPLECGFDGATGDNCYAYAQLSYWEIPGDAEPACGLVAGDTLVQIDSTTYFTFPAGTEIDVELTADAHGVWTVTPRLGGAACYGGLTEKIGNFPVTAPLTPNESDPTGYDLTRIKPSFVQPITADTRGISQTCLLSVDPNNPGLPGTNRFLGG